MRLKEHGFWRVRFILLYDSKCVANRFSFRYDPSGIWCT